MLAGLNGSKVPPDKTGHVWDRHCATLARHRQLRLRRMGHAAGAESTAEAQQAESQPSTSQVQQQQSLWSTLAAGPVAGVCSRFVVCELALFPIQFM